jgi:ABC-2 type transport system permease protein
MNTIGTITLCKREIWRFMKVWNQTIIAPVVTSLIFLAVLTLAMGGASRTIEGFSYVQFIAPGLIMMAIVQNAFANTSSSLMLAKIQGVIIDLLMPPLSGAEITFALVVGGVVRGFCVGLAVAVALYVLVPFTIEHPIFALFHIVAASIMLALLGVLGGVWAQTFDQIAAVTNYVITPFAFLSGTFYSIKALPEFWYHLCHFNPFFYMIDGFRYAMIGYSDSSPMLGFAVMTSVNIVLWVVIQQMIKRGYRLKQ